MHLCVQVRRVDGEDGQISRRVTASRQVKAVEENAVGANTVLVDALGRDQLVVLPHHI